MFNDKQLPLEEYVEELEEKLLAERENNHLAGLMIGDLFFRLEETAKYAKRNVIIDMAIVAVVTVSIAIMLFWG